jgi:hypothetical protein
MCRVITARKFVGVNTSKLRLVITDRNLLFSSPPVLTAARVIHERCTRLIECLPSLQHDPNRPEDVLKVDADEDGVGGHDAADSLRYLVATRERKVTQRKLRGL